MKLDQDFIKEFEKAYNQANKELGRFNLVIFGKTGAGKSTLINAMFGSEVAKVGTGKPVTTRTEYFLHPSEYFGVYDSEGVEIGQEGDEILAKFEQIIDDSRTKGLSEQIHVVWYCIRASDERIEAGQVEFIRRLAKMGLPVMLVLTKAYPLPSGDLHPNELAFAQYCASSELGLPIRPEGQVFLTLAQDDEHRGAKAHGLKELLDATFQVAPEGVEAALTAAQKVDLSRNIKEAQKYVVGAAGLAATAGATPIPFADAAVLVPIQTGMMAKISAIFGIPVRAGTLATLAGAAFAAGGVTQLGKYTVTSLLKFIPGAGSVAAGVIRAGVASSLTAAVGAAWIAVCSQLARLSPAVVEAMAPDEIRKLFLTEFKKAAKKTGKGKS